MSLAILPSSPITYGQTPVPTLLPPGPPSKRPKLTLDTNGSSSVFGKPSTSLRLETLSATSPTVRNTFRNGYDAAQQQKKSRAMKRPALTPLSTTVSPDTRRRPTPLRTEVPPADDIPELTSSSAVSSSSVSTLDSLSTEAPYKIAYNVTSILSNGPIPRTRSNRNPYARSRPMFPAAKKVAFRAPLTEEIQTTKYTVAHSDIESSLSSIATTDASQVERRAEQETSRAVKHGVAKGAARVAISIPPHTGEKRESSDEEDSDTCPATPVAGRRKKSRVWRWTLGPVDGAPAQARPNEAGIGEEKTEGT